jgi:hypothetical protein
MTAKKRPVGRPPSDSEIGKRYTVYLLPSIVERLKAYGDGSLSVGIVEAAKRLKK